MSAKKSRPLLRAFIFLMIALVLFSTVAIIAVYTSGTPTQTGINTGTWAIGTWDTGTWVVAQPIAEPTIIIPGSATGTTATGADDVDAALGSDIQLSLTGA